MNTIISNADTFVMNNGTEFQKKVCNYLMGRGEKKEAIDALNAYQNDDGGWANGLEIEYQGPVSTPFASAEALGYMYKFGLQDGQNLEKTIEYLKKTQLPDGSWDDVEEMDQYEHPPYMGKGIYRDYKTGQNISWLIRMKIDEKEMIKNGISYMVSVFPEISKGQDFWSAVAYANVFTKLPEHPKTKEILAWSLGLLMPSEQIVWQQAMGMLFDDVVPPAKAEEVKALIEANQKEDGGWEHPFGVYNAVWLAIMIIRFLK